MVQQQLSSEIKNHLESFKEMQKTSPLLQHTKYKLLAGDPPHGKSEYMQGRRPTGRGHTGTAVRKKKGRMNWHSRRRQGTQSQGRVVYDLWCR